MSVRRSNDNYAFCRSAHVMWRGSGIASAKAASADTREALHGAVVTRVARTRMKLGSQKDVRKTFFAPCSARSLKSRRPADRIMDGDGEVFESPMETITPALLQTSSPEMSETERVARSVIAGNEEDANLLLAWIMRQDREKAIPTLYALRVIVQEPTNAVGVFAFKCIGDYIGKTTGKDRDGVIVGNLLMLVAIHRPAALSGAVRRIFEDRALSVIALDAILSLRSFFLR